jgi:hypothetical protein
LQGKILGAARQNIDYISVVDPAKYNVGTINNNGNFWAENHVGEIWWDINRARFIDPNQDDIVYASRRWGQLFPESSVDIYQWIESSVPPGVYAGPGTPLDTTSYVVTSRLTPQGTFGTQYYFWITGINTINTSAGKTFPQAITINSPSGAVILQDNFAISNTLTLTEGTFNANSYSFTATSFNSSGTITRTIAFGSGAWTLTGTSFAYNVFTSTNLTVTGSTTINMSSASAKTFAGGSFNYSNITLNQAGLGTLTVSGNNTFKNITSTYSTTGATTIDLATTTTTVNQFTATGFNAKVLTVSGTSPVSIANLIFTGEDISGINFLTFANVRAFPVTNTWYAGSSSTIAQTLGFLPINKPVNYGRFFLMFG